MAKNARKLQIRNYNGNIPSNKKPLAKVFFFIILIVIITIVLLKNNSKISEIITKIKPKQDQIAKVDKEKNGSNNNESDKVESNSANRLALIKKNFENARNNKKQEVDSEEQQEKIENNPILSKTIRVRVLTKEGDVVFPARISSTDCGISRKQPMAEESEEITLRGREKCTLRAGRQDGMLIAWSKDVIIPLNQEITSEVIMTVPSEKTAGIGLQIQKDIDNGIVVIGVIPNGPAQVAGIVAGDIILEVDGESTQDMGIIDFIRKATGIENTAVRLSVMKQNGKNQSINVKRQILNNF